MLAIIDSGKKKYAVDLNKPLDISIPLQSGVINPNAFHIQPALFEPFRAGTFVGSVALGGSTNCENLFINAHGNGTHTECVGHISKERITINQCLKHFFSLAQVITVAPKQHGNDFIIAAEDVIHLISEETEALVIRTIPNSLSKQTQVYSGTNPVYFEAELCVLLREKGIKHLLTDLPSVDREEDEGALAAHHAFWNHPEQTRLDATITEMIFVEDEIPDGSYLLNLQIASIESDASPSKPVLYDIH